MLDFCDAVLHVLFNFATIPLRKRELDALLLCAQSGY